jgi:hypothetical protein
MRQKFFFLTAIFVCLALALAPAMAAERTTERSTDRTERGSVRGATADATGDVSGPRPTQIPRNSAMADTLQEGDGSLDAVRSLSRSRAKNAGQLVTRAQYFAQRGDTARAISTLQQVLSMDLVSSPENDKIRFFANRQLAQLYEGTDHKQVHYLGAALQFASTAGEREEIEDQILALGGDVFDVTFSNGASYTSTSKAKAQARTHNDCSTADPAPVGAGFVLIVPGVTIPATHDWFVFDITDPGGQVASIQTAGWDTDLTLWTGTCDALEFVQFDDDSGGPDFSSLINTDCIDPGTYYIELGGWLDIVAGGAYELRVDLDDCPQDLPLDKYEPDNDPTESTGIGQPNSAPPDHSNHWGRVNKQTQDHSIALGGDDDTVRFNLTRNERVRASTRIQHGSFFNDFEEINFDPAGENCQSGGGACDPNIRLTYNEPKEWGGLCFDGNGFMGYFTCACDTGGFDSSAVDSGQQCNSTLVADHDNDRLCPRKGSCSGDSPDPCINGQFCPSGACVTDDDCPADETCDQVAFCEVATGTACFTDADCPPMDTCALTMLCGISRVSCETDADCDEGDACDTLAAPGTFNTACPFQGTPGGDACQNQPGAAGEARCSNMQALVSGDPFGSEGCSGENFQAEDRHCGWESLARNDDRSGTDLGAEMAFCLPQTSPGGPEPAVNGPWNIQVRGFGLQQFHYEVRVTAEAGCPDWETEPNDTFTMPTRITLGEPINAWHAYSRAQEGLGDQVGSFYGEEDIFAFNPPTVGTWVMETESYDPNLTDTFMALWAGPDGDGNFLFTGFFDNNGGEGALSRIEIPFPLPPAPDLFGVPEAEYLLVIDSNWLTQDYPYTLATEFTAAAVPESEPNDILSGGTPMAIFPGNAISASIAEGCDYDMFRVQLIEDTFVTFETAGFTDTTMQIVDCQSAALMYNACDDDGGTATASRIEGCMPAGDVCLRVRGFSAFTTGDYDFIARPGGTCTATDPPLVTAGRDFTCSQLGAFETCP